MFQKVAPFGKVTHFSQRLHKRCFSFRKCCQRVPTMFQQFALKFPKYDHCSKTSLQRCKVSEVCSLISVWEKNCKYFFFLNKMKTTIGISFTSLLSAILHSRTCQHVARVSCQTAIDQQFLMLNIFYFQIKIRIAINEINICMLEFKTISGKNCFCWKTKKLLLKSCRETELVVTPRQQ